MLGERCSSRYIPARALEDLVWRNLCEVLAAPEMIAHAMARARGGHWLPQELQARRANLRRGRVALGQQVERLTDAYLAGIVFLAEYQRRRHDTEARLQALDRQEVELTRDAKRQGETAGLAAHAETFCRRVREGLTNADFDQKRALLELLVDRVVVTDGSVEMSYIVSTGPHANESHFGDCVRTVEAAIARWKQVIGDGLRAGAEERRATEVAVAVHALNRMLEFGGPISVRIA